MMFSKLIQKMWPAFNLFGNSTRRLFTANLIDALVFYFIIFGMALVKVFKGGDTNSSFICSGGIFGGIFIGLFENAVLLKNMLISSRHMFVSLFGWLFLYTLPFLF